MAFAAITDSHACRQVGRGHALVWRHAAWAMRLVDQHDRRSVRQQVQAAWLGLYMRCAASSIGRQLGLTSGRQYRAEE